PGAGHGGAGLGRHAGHRLGRRARDRPAASRPSPQRRTRAPRPSPPVPRPMTDTRLPGPRPRTCCLLSAAVLLAHAAVLGPLGAGRVFAASTPPPALPAITLAPAAAWAATPQPDAVTPQAMP